MTPSSLSPACAEHFSQNPQRNDPRHRAMDTSPSNKVKAPQRLNTPRARLRVHDLQILLQVTDRIRTADHDLDDDVVADEGRQATEGLLARTADADLQRVAALVQHDTCVGTTPSRNCSHAAASTPSSPPDQVQAHFRRCVSTRDARDVLHRVLEKDQVHDRVALVVLLERVLEHREHLVHALHLVVRVLLDVLRGNEITKPPRLARATWRRSRGRLDGVTVAWRRADAIDAKFKLRN